ncbi:MAG: DNA repair protein RadA [Clostridia bacterium]|nr:DNA repair protein RadA [Clostridia bacterium]
MAKNKSTVFFCKECGYESSGWLGKCPGCNSWNTFVEEPKGKPATQGVSRLAAMPAYARSAPVSIKNAGTISNERRSSGIGELDRVLGGGLVKGSLVLVSGDPGIGKSTLMLMISGNIADSSPQEKVLYISGEESAEQIKMRAERLGVDFDNLYVVSETSMSAAESMIEELSPAYLVVDSVQTMYDDSITSAAGSVSQVREITAKLMQIAKSVGITTFVVGHVTKEGSIAGPRVLEHMVDTVLYFEGERHMSYRILRCVKNRFGSTNEIGVFEMRDTGLVEITNPSAVMLDGRADDAPGTAVACTMEGSRPLLVEIQALVSGSNQNVPRRMSTGVDFNRFAMLLAVLEKRLNFRIGQSDAFVNVAGGMRITEPAVDLAIIAAVISSCRNVPVSPDSIFFGEVGLTGEIRAVNHAEKRVAEAARLGFKRFVVPEGNRKAVSAFVSNHPDRDALKIDYVKSMRDIVL